MERQLLSPDYNLPGTSNLARLLLVLLLDLVSSVGLAAEIAVVDDLDNAVVLDRPAQRIISLSPHITESLFAAGAGEKIVATVQFSNYPEQAAQIPVIGSYREIAYEAIIALNPDLVIVWASGNGEEIIARLRSLGLTLYLDEPRSIEDIAASLRNFGKLAGSSGIAEAQADELLGRLDTLGQRDATEPAVRVFYEVWNDPLTSLNGEHLVSDIIRLCGGENIFATAIPLAPVVSTESVLAADPQLIVVSGMDEERPEWLDEWRRWPGLTAAETNQLRFIPPDLLQRNSPRIIQGAELMCEYVAEAREASSGDS